MLPKINQNVAKYVLLIGMSGVAGHKLIPSIIDYTNQAWESDFVQNSLPNLFNKLVHTITPTPAFIAMCLDGLRSFKSILVQFASNLLPNLLSSVEFLGDKTSVLLSMLFDSIGKPELSSVLLSNLSSLNTNPHFALGLISSLLALASTALVLKYTPAGTPVGKAASKVGELGTSAVKSVFSIRGATHMAVGTACLALGSVATANILSDNTMSGFAP